MNGWIIALMIIIAALIVFIAVILIRFIFGSGKSAPSDIHISGGADINDGRIKDDNNYLKAIQYTMNKTVYYSEDKIGKNSGFNIQIQNMNTGSVKDVSVRGEFVIGRSAENVMLVINDKCVSSRHCCLNVYNDRLFISDCNSSNHTFLNGKMITDITELRSGDTIKIGNTFLKVYF